MTHDGRALENLQGKAILIIAQAKDVSLNTRHALHDFGAAIIDPVPSMQHAEAAVTMRKPDAAIVDINISASDALWVNELFLMSGIPYVFAQMATPRQEMRSKGFYLVADNELLAAVATVLFPVALNQEGLGGNEPGLWRYLVPSLAASALSSLENPGEENSRISVSPTPEASCGLDRATARLRVQLARWIEENGYVRGK